MKNQLRSRENHVAETPGVCLCTRVAALPYTHSRQTAHLWVEEYFRPQEPFVPNIYDEFLLVDRVDACVLFDPLPGIHIILSKLLDNVRTDVTVFLLHVHTKTSPNINSYPAPLPSHTHTETPCITHTRSATHQMTVWMQFMPYSINCHLKRANHGALDSAACFLCSSAINLSFSLNAGCHTV